MDEAVALTAEVDQNATTNPVASSSQQEVPPRADRTQHVSIFDSVLLARGHLYEIIKLKDNDGEEHEEYSPVSIHDFRNIDMYHQSSPRDRTVRKLPDGRVLESFRVIGVRVRGSGDILSEKVPLAILLTIEKEQVKTKFSKPLPIPKFLANAAATLKNSVNKALLYPGKNYLH
jgi:hypothetical protein